MRGRIECSQIRAPACAKYAAEGHEGKGGWVREGGGGRVSPRWASGAVSMPRAHAGRGVGLTVRVSLARVRRDASLHIGRGAAER